jgi:sugar porter (SP) family MFS transporter
MFAFSFIAIGGLLFGYIIGINSNVLTEGQLLCADDYTGTAGTWTSWGYGQCWDLSTLTIGLLSSISLIGAMFSTLVCFRYADDLGRKLEAQIGALLYMVGSFVAALSPMLWGVVLGLFMYGMAVGFAMHVAPLYIAEISPADIRGTLVSAKEAIIVFGMFLGFFTGWVFSSLSSDGWRLMILCGGFMATAMFCGVCYVPQSPRYLVLMAARRGNGAGEEEEALAALTFLRGGASDEAKDELRGLRSDVETSLRSDKEVDGLLQKKGAQEMGALAAFAYPTPLIVGCGIVILQQITGQPSVLYYATNVFKSAGFGDSSSQQSVLLGLVKLVATLFTVWRVDHYGRRPLLLVGISMMTVALAVCSVGFSTSYCTTPGLSTTECSTDDLEMPQAWAIVTVAGLMVYVSGYQVGFGPIAWLLISEIFPLSVRGSALSVAAMANFSFNVAVTFSTASLMSMFGTTGLFSIFLVLSVFSIWFVYAVVPETKGKTLEEIEAMMKA